MQLFSRKKALVACSLGALFALGACSDTATVPVVVPPVVISITPQNASMNIGESLNLAVQITGGSTTAVPTLASCTSSNAAVATASISGAACKVTAVTSGNVTISAAASTGNSASAFVVVAAAANAISNLTTSPTTASIAVGQSVTIVPNVTRAATSVTPTYSYATSSSAIATVSAAGVVSAVAPGTATITVTALGSGTGFSTTTLTSGVTVTVTAAPSAITALTVQPSSLVMALGSTLTLNSTAAQPTGAAAATISYSSSVPTVASVGATSGLVTAVAPGTAVITVTATAAGNTSFAATTMTQLVPVTVTPSANVTIQDIRQGPIVTSAVNNTNTSSSPTTTQAGILTSANAQVNQPIDITNTRDQIQVLINLQPNGQRVDSVVVFIANADGSSRRAAARQLYSNGTANASVITLFVNTADFDADFTAGTATIFYPNGQKIISTSVYTTNSLGVAQEIQNASNNRQVVNFNNVDGYAARFVAPTNVATNPATNLNYAGGPGATGTGTATIVPVFYTAGRQVSTLMLGMREGIAFSFDVCNETGVVTPVGATVAIRAGSNLSREPYTAAPFRTTFNGDLGRDVTVGTSTLTGFNTVGNANLECLGYEHPASNQSNMVGVVSGTDNQNNSIPLVTFAAGYRSSAQIAQPTPVRLDYLAPSTIQPDLRRASPAVTGWVNAGFNFNNNTAASTDAGVGMPTTQARAWSYRPAGGSPGTSACGSDTTWVAMPTATGADIPECATNFVGGWDNINNITRAAAPYFVYYMEADRLGNSAISPQSGRFGVDKIISNTRWSAASRADTAIVGVGGTVDFQSEAIDERSGFVDPSDQGSGGTFPAPTKSSTGVISTLAATTRSQSHFASRAWAGSLASTTTSTSTKANCINGDNFTPITSSGAPVNAGTTFLTAPNCAFNTPTTAIGAILGDGWRQGSAVVLEASEGLYNYQSRWTDRAGNVTPVSSLRLAVESSSPTIVNLLMPVLVTAATGPVIGYEAQDNVEIRAATMANQYANLPTTTWLRYPQVLQDARFNDNINSPVGAGQSSVPTAAPYVLGIANSFGGATLTTPFAALNTWNVRNNPSNTLQGGYLTQAFPTLNSFDAQFGAGAYTSWSVLPSRVAGFNAPEGLKAQLVSNTNVTNQAFVRVDFFRLTASGSDFSGTAGQQWQYLGSSTTAASADIGTTRFWTFQLPDASYASLPNSFETKQSPAQLGDVIIAVGVRSNGAGLVTTSTPIGGTAIQITVNGLPAGGAANISITDGAGFTLNVTSSGIYSVPAAGNYFVNAGNTLIGTQNFAPTVTSQTVTVTSGTLATATVTYGIAATQISVTVSGLFSGSGAFTINGPAGYTASYTQAVGTITYAVPTAGTYTITGAATQTIGGFTYNPITYTISAGGVVTVGPSPTTATVVFANGTQRLNFNVVLPVGVVLPAGAATATCTTGLAVTNLVAGSQTFTVGQTATPSVGCSMTAAAFTTGGFTYLPSPAGTTAVTASTLNTLPVNTITYTLATPQLTIRSQSIGGGTNNLPNGIPFTVRVSSSAYSATGGFQDFSGFTGTDLVIPVPGNGTYNVSIRNQLTLTSQQWQVAVVGDVTASGGLTTGTPALSGSPQNIVVSNFVLGPSGSPILANFQGLVVINWTGPLP